ncbi:hypothetical protein NAT51_14030 [Flavobacterium amniphilum]|uniref:hypothetical protein n=1 Tax=Flavobacterium amniphilum TaxID=1834035 RepID=UPI00202A1806|nr:hypothetical protein [Flavobacterium amniphilum]MCL9806650.1 hypothetical protein [Flavobacterium amniphilum]
MFLQAIIDFSLKILFLIVFLYSCPVFSQNAGLGIKEKEYSSTGQYTKPTQISFAFAGDDDYTNYYFNDLKEHIFKEFTKKGIQVSFPNVPTNTPTFSLKVSDSKVIHENGGYDREIRYTLDGVLYTNNTLEPLLSFKITVNTLHDMNQQNKEVVKYLLGKIEG